MDMNHRGDGKGPLDSAIGIVIHSLEMVLRE